MTTTETYQQAVAASTAASDVHHAAICSRMIAEVAWDQSRPGTPERDAASLAYDTARMAEHAARDLSVIAAQAMQTAYVATHA